MYYDFPIPQVNEADYEPNGTYTFVVYGGNGNPALEDEATFGGASVRLVTTTEIDPEPPHKPIIYDSSLEYFGNGVEAGFIPDWLNTVSQNIGVYYLESKGVAEWLEYAVVSGIDSPITEDDFQAVSGTLGTGTSGHRIDSADAVSSAAFAADGAYTVAFRIKDLNGSTSEYAVMYVLHDSTDPTVSDLRFYTDSTLTQELDSYTPKNSELSEYEDIGSFFGTAAYIAVDSDDASLSSAVYGRFTGTLTVEYALTEGAAPGPGAQWHNYAGYMTLPESGSDFTGTVWFRATDRAGNTTPAYLSSGKLMINTEQPEAISAVNIQRLVEGIPSAYVDAWSYEDVMFTLSGGASLNTTLDQYQYCYKIGEGEYSGWQDFQT
jgi:hypothetical protein